MSGFLILHGIENHRPPLHWQFQLAAELARHGHEVRYPDLPHPDAPQLDAWLRALGDELALLSEGELVVVCHSLACLLWFHAAGTIAARADRVMVVSPPDSDEVPHAGASFRLEHFTEEPVLVSDRRELAIVCSDADPYNPLGAQALYGDPLGIDATIISGGGHITPADGYGRWPLVEDWCLAAQARP
ncbi:MAG: RBBP9/YdeN family alpha/beta hydrolase [Solirubrobacteraceae bacterium]